MQAEKKASIVPTKIEPVDTKAPTKMEKPKQDFMVPYWMVRGTTTDEDINLVAGTVVVEVEGTKHTVPVLKNSKNVTAGDCLWKKAAASSSNETAKKVVATPKVAAVKKGAPKAAAKKGKK